MFITGCTGSCQNDNIQCSQWWKFRQNDHICVSVYILLLYYYNDVILGMIVSQITSLTIVYSAVYSDADQRKHQSSASLAICAGNSPGTGEFPAQMARNAEIVSFWWRHHTQADRSSADTDYRIQIHSNICICNTHAYICIHRCLYTLAEIIMEIPSPKKCLFQFRLLIHFDI